MPYDWKTELPGIFALHADTCPRRNGGVCVCGPLGYRSTVIDPSTGRSVLSPEFESVADAQTWQREQQQPPQQQQTFTASRSVAVSGAELGSVIDDFLQEAEDGQARDRHGEPYDRDRVRQLRASLSYVDSALGSMNLEDVRHRHVQAMLDQLRSSGATSDRLTSVAAALRSLYAYAIQRDLVGYSPVVELGLPEPETFGSDPAQHVNGAAPADTLTGVMAQAPPAPAPQAPGESLSAMPIETVMWWAIKIVVLLFALIALVLAAESV
jgi:hypothetical protein